MIILLKMSMRRREKERRKTGMRRNEGKKGVGRK